MSYFSGQRKHSRQRRLQQQQQQQQQQLHPVMNLNEIYCCPPSPQQQQQQQQVPLLNSPELRLRFLSPEDIHEVKRLCKDWFPIDYPDAWYTDVTSNRKFYSVAAVYHGRIIGIVVSEVKESDKLPKEDANILGKSILDMATRGLGPARIGYILSLGVVREFRQNGVASFLLDNLISHLTSWENQAVQAIYLHVLTTNSQAISFYENRGFRPHLFLPYYYNIKGRRRDGYTYVLYLNGGHPPRSPLDHCFACCGSAASSVFSCLWQMAALVGSRGLWFLPSVNLTPRLRQIAQSSAAILR